METTVRTYQDEFLVRYNEISAHRLMNPVALLNLMQESATRHAGLIGYGIDHILQTHQAWALSRWHVRICRYPVFNERLVVSTWPYSVDRITARREFRVESERGVIAIATSRWAYMDLDRRRPTRAPIKTESLHWIQPVAALEVTPEPIDAPHTDPDCCRSFHVGWQDVDQLRHCNNTAYVGWFLETLPNGWMLEQLPVEIEVEYKRELTHGDDVTCSAYIDRAAHVTLHRCALGETTAAVARIRWQPFG